ncbi:unnamed protein product [Kluyveromyces dobzhanskii CBS 2104]|uniref:WGS project CCBQ000000000 data, contig 00106 n=1 Tax=Kluyveromyces dobzhanskii CBS 2104 TaxID=1427455 RepID=A0A0A8L5U1_9SACH|nr:unnamed protein product [Kluyveromyces dobzhanskii CBS 2104]
MRLDSVLSKALALATVASAATVHKHHVVEEKRDVTVVVTNFVNENGQVLTQASTEATTDGTTTLQPVTDLGDSKSVDTISTTSTVKSVSSASSSTTSSTASSSGSGTSSSGTGEYGGALGITYSPYSSSGTCKSSDVIKSDIESLSQFNVIRIYDTDCDSIEPILASLQSSQKIFLGIYDIDKIAASVSIIESAFNGDFSKVYAISVGNELVNAGTNTVSEVSSAVESARTQLSAIGYTGDIVTVDTLVATENNSGLCSVSDFIAVNCHPYWDGNVDPSNCGPWVKTQIDNLSSTCNNGKTILITETGWPTEGNTYGTCVPSKANQETCIKSIIDSIGDQAILFTTYNDYWKDAGDEGVEQYWGIFGDSSV